MPDLPDIEDIRRVLHAKDMPDETYDVIRRTILHLLDVIKQQNALLVKTHAALKQMSEEMKEEEQHDDSWT